MVSLLAFVIPMIAMLLFSNYFAIKINVSDSLANQVFLIRKGTLPERIGQLIVFKAPHGSGYKEPFIKIVGGMQGDQVSRVNKEYFVNSKLIGTVKDYDKRGNPTVLGPVGAIPEGKYFVYTDHKDSYDSKYEGVGWVDSKHILGVAYAIY